MTETVRRRLNHPEWPLPNLIIIDGGVGQLAAAKKALQQTNLAAPITIISFAKPQRLIYGLRATPTRLVHAKNNLGAIIPRVIQETHNYAIRFHRQRRDRAFR